MSLGHILSPEQLVRAWPGVGVGVGCLLGQLLMRGILEREGPFGAGLSGLITLRGLEISAITVVFYMSRHI